MYKIIKQLGSGAFADVYLAVYNNKQVAVKIPNDSVSKSEAISYSTREVAILENFKNSQYIINIINYKIDVDNNYIITELLGDDLYTIFRHYRKIDQKIPLPVVKKFCKEILNGLIELKKCNIFHNDLKLENILFTKPLNHIFTTKKRKYIADVFDKVSSYNNEFITYPDNYIKNHVDIYYNVMMELLLRFTHIKIVDFGGAFSKEMTFQYESEYLASRPTRYYISPERLVKAPVWLEADMWAFGCIVFELLTNDILYSPIRNNNMGINCAHIGMIIKIIGEFPQHLIKNGIKSHRYFINGIYKFKYLIGRFLSLPNYLRRYQLKKNIANKNEINDIINFLNPILEIDPIKRSIPEDIINSSWLL